MFFTHFSIATLASVSYLIGFYAILWGVYRPNLFTRTVFLCIALNNLASVIKLENETSTLVLAWVTLLGSLLIFLGSIIFKGERFWGKNEIISTVLLIISILIWISTDIPLINLSIGLIAHSIGSLPTVIRVIKKPESENIPFWLLFALASFITLFSIQAGGTKAYLFSSYFCVFDSMMVILALRKYTKNSL